MSDSPGGARILLVDRQEHWRDPTARALGEAGFVVADSGDYDLPLAGDKLSVDLVVVGCARIGAEEMELIREITDHKYHIVVLATYLPWDSMRAAFLAGAEDVTEKSYDPERVVDMVRQALGTISSRDQSASAGVAT